MGAALRARPCDPSPGGRGPGDRGPGVAVPAPAAGVPAAGPARGAPATTPVPGPPAISPVRGALAASLVTSPVRGGPARARPRAPRGPPGAALPAPPPLSAPLGMAGTGPMPQLSQTMMPPSDTIWWTLPPPGQAQGPPGQAQAARPRIPGVRAARAHAPRVCAPCPGPDPARSPHAAIGRPGGTDGTGPVVGAVALALGILLLVIGAVSQVSIVVIGGLVAGAWGIWRLVTATGKGGRPPANPRSSSAASSTPSRSPALVPTNTTMTFCWRSLVTMIGALPLLVYSAMLPVMNGVLLLKSDWHSMRKSVKSLPVVHSRSLWKFTPLRKLLTPLVSAVGLGYR